MNPFPLCELLPWDSAHFGFPVARINTHLLQTSSFPLIEDWARQELVRCLYLLLPASAGDLRYAAERHGYHLADIRVTLEADLSAPPPSGNHPALRPLHPADLPALLPLAAASHTDTRFFQDPNFPRTAAAALYEIWLQKAASNPAAQVFTALQQGQPAGYITCHPDASIGLLAVADFARGAGLGRALLAQALAWFAARGAPRVRVVTQGRNTQALRLYERSGFMVHSVELWYHRWFS